MCHKGGMVIVSPISAEGFSCFLFCRPQVAPRKSLRASRSVLLSSIVCFGAVLVTMLPAQAAWVQTKKEAAGTKTTVGTMPAWMGNWSNPGSSSISTVYDGPAPGETQGSITFTFTWQPSYPGEAVPATASVKISSSATATVSDPQSVLTLSVENGFGDPGITTTHAPQTGWTKTVSSAGTWLKQTGGKSVVTFTVNLSAKVTGGSGNHCRVSAGATATPDNRTVTINSGSFGPQNFRKENLIGPPVSGSTPQPLENKRKDDGSMVVDSAVYWNQVQHSWMGSFGCSAHLPGFTLPTYEWSFDGNIALGYSQPSVYSNMSFTTAVKFGANGPSTTTVTLKATDSDGVKGSNTYAVRWHLPYEKTGNLPDKTNPKTKIRMLVGPVEPAGISILVVTQPETFDFGAAIDGVAVVVGVAGQVEVAAGIEIFKAVTGLVKLTHDQPGEESPGWRNDGTQWHYTAGTYPGNIANATSAVLQDPFGYEDYDMQIWQVKHSTHKSWVCDKYSVSGFESSGHIFSANSIDGIDKQAYYVTHRVLN